MLVEVFTGRSNKPGPAAYRPIADSVTGPKKYKQRLETVETVYAR
jgi:hypothetical protein